MSNKEILYETKCKPQMTVDDFLRAFTEIKEKFGGNIPVCSYDIEMDYQDCTDLFVENKTFFDGSLDVLYNGPTVFINNG